MGRVQGKVAVVTGASAGIGRATIKMFAKEGASVFAIGRTPSKVDAVVSEIKSVGGTAAGFAADLSRPAEAQAAVEALIQTYGRVDVLVNSAGVGYSWQAHSPGSMNETVTCAPEKWREVMSINLDSVFLMCRLIIPHMQRQGGGAIVNVASIWGMVGAVDAHAYTAAKGAMINYTRSLCVTYAKDNIRTNALCPGFVDTEMVAQVTPLFNDPVAGEAISPSRRPGTPEEMAYACLYLGSDESSYCNGSLLIADGGSTAR
jgi:NAD(P)-dependent dehydrogenase (short-subunit alcohol dehydrogenase family)